MFLSKKVKSSACIPPERVKIKTKQNKGEKKEKKEGEKQNGIHSFAHFPWSLPIFWDLVKWEISKSCTIPQSKSFSYTSSCHICTIMRTSVSAVSHSIQFGIWSYLQLLRQVWLAVTWKMLLELLFSTDELTDFVSPSVNYLLCFLWWSMPLYIYILLYFPLSYIPKWSIIEAFHMQCSFSHIHSTSSFSVYKSCACTTFWWVFNFMHFKNL